MAYPSKFLLVAATLHHRNKLSHTANVLLQAASRRHVKILSSPRLYSTPSASIDSANLLDKAPNLDDAFLLPPPPASFVPPSASETAQSLVDLGLGSYYPPGLVQYGYDFLHSLGLPWWSCIVVGAVTVRTLMIPLFAAVQRNAVNMANHAPELQQFQLRTLAANSMGDRVGVLKIMKEQKAYLKEHDISHLRHFRLMIAQSTVFVSMFMGLRGMAEAPIASFKTEGLLHIVDLTVRDPLFVLPCVTTATLLFIIMRGAEGMDLKAMPPLIQKMFKVMPCVMFIPVAYFPAALGLYWVMSNFFSMGQFFLFQSEFGKKLFKLPKKRAMPAGFNMFPDRQGFAEQFSKMMETAREAEATNAKLQSMQLSDDRKQWEGLKGVGESNAAPPLSPEEVASRHSDIKRMIKEINEMKKKVESLDSESNLKLKSKEGNKPPDIHIKIPKDKLE